jgi:hypothetical protein
MISFRFHIVSITAVFLAIAIGVVVGTTYVDRAVVDSLEHRVDRVSDNLDQRKAENDALGKQLSQQRAYVETSASYAVAGRLEAVPVLLVAARGVDDDIANQTLSLLRTAGADVAGITWLEERWGLDGDDDRSALATAGAIPEQGSDASLRNAGLSAMVAAFGTPAEGTPPAADAAVVNGLVDGGFLSLDGQADGTPLLADLAGRAPRVLLLTTSDVSSGLAPVVAQLAGRSAAAGLPTVAAEAFVEHNDGPERGEAITKSLAESTRDHVGLVDDAELPEGRVAAVLALGEVAAGRIDHFGYGSGADGALPAWTAP